MSAQLPAATQGILSSDNILGHSLRIISVFAQIVQRHYGIMPFEMEDLCQKLEGAGVEFTVEGSSCIDPRSDNAAAAITFINNAFSFGGLKDCYRIVVRRDNLSKAQEALGIAPFNENFDGQD